MIDQQLFNIVFGALVLNKYPTVDIWSINHKGAVDVIIDDQ